MKITKFFAAGTIALGSVGVLAEAELVELEYIHQEEMGTKDDLTILLPNQKKVRFSCQNQGDVPQKKSYKVVFDESNNAVVKLTKTPIPQKQPTTSEPKSYYSDC